MRAPPSLAQGGGRGEPSGACAKCPAQETFLHLTTPSCRHPRSLAWPGLAGAEEVSSWQEESQGEGESLGTSPAFLCWELGFASSRGSGIR